MAIIDNLLAYYPLDEASGNAIDAHGANDLTETGGTIAAASGPGGVGGSRDVEAGDTEGFEIADNADFSMGDISFTITAWVNIESLAGANRPVVAKYTSAGNQREYVVVYQLSPNLFTFRVSADGIGNTEVQATTFGAPSIATWYFLAAYHDATGNVIGISVNAGTINTAAHTTGVFDGTSAFQVGDNGPSFGTYDGLIAQVGVWKNRVLSADDITWLYNSGNGRTYAAVVAGDAAGVVARRCVTRQAVNRASTY